MAEGEGNGRSYDRVEELEETYQTNMWRSFKDAASKVSDEHERALALYVFNSESVEEVAHRIRGIQRGTWLDNLLLAGAAVGGMMAGYKAQEWVDIRKGPVPVTGLLGLAGVVPGALMDRSLTTRNVVGLGGMMFLAGAGLYQSGHPDEGEGGGDE